MTKQWLYGRCDQYGGMVGAAGSNLQPIGYEPTALTIELQARIEIVMIKTTRPQEPIKRI